MSAMAEEPEATAAEETKAVSAVANQAEALAAKMTVSTVGEDPETVAMRRPRRQGDGGHVRPPRPSRRRPR